MNTKIAVVAGGAGGVGEGIVRTLLANGYTVIVPTRSKAKSDSLHAYVGDVRPGKLIVRVGDAFTESGAEAFKANLESEFGHIDLAVVSLGGWHQGYPVYAYPMQEWNRILHDNITAHFLAIKSLVPILHPTRGLYVHINGFGAEEPYPMAGPVCMAAAAQKSLILTLAKELHQTGIQVHELILGPMKTRERLKYGHGQPDWYFPEEVGDYIVQLVQAPTRERALHYLLSKTKT